MPDEEGNGVGQFRTDHVVSEKALDITESMDVRDLILPCGALTRRPLRKKDCIGSRSLSAFEGLQRYQRLAAKRLT